MLMLPTFALTQRSAPAFAGTWKCVDAVDDNEKPFAIVIRRAGHSYEFIDPTVHPRLVLRGRATGSRLTFVQKGDRGTTTYVFTRHNGKLTKDRSADGSHLGFHYVRISR
jgi:hypothetical protein